jgi:L-fucose isomerase
MTKHPKVGIRPIIDGRERGVRESLEVQTMNMAKRVAELISSTLKYGDGTAVKCVIADGTIGRVPEAAACAEKFEREGVGLTISVTPCWCYGSETIDMNPHYPKAIWGFNGTERPGAVYLAAAMAAHNQKGLPAFGIYGRDVQDSDDNTIPEDVKEKLLRFTRAGLAVAEMRGKSYLSIGGVCMGIAGSMVNPDFFQEYLGMRNEYIDMVEVSRRIDKGIYDHEEYKKAWEWTLKYCKVNEGEDFNDPQWRKTRAEKDADWEYVVKMYLVIRDLMVGNPKLAELGFKEESLGHNAIVAGFQGQRQWTDYLPNCDFPEALLNSSFDWNGLRRPYILATEKLKMEIQAETDISVQHEVDLDANYFMDVNYDVSVPLSFGQDFNLTIRDTISDLDSTIIEMAFAGGGLELFGTISNSIPMELDIQIIPIDKFNEIIPIETITQKIQSGKVDGSATDSDLSLRILDSDGLLKDLSGFILEFTASSNETVAGTPIKPENFVKATLKARLFGGIIIGE